MWASRSFRPSSIQRTSGAFAPSSARRCNRCSRRGKSKPAGFADNRQGFVVLNVASEEEAFMLLNEIADFCVMETHPLISFETLGKYFAEHPPI
jgi:hypothetical protein